MKTLEEKAQLLADGLGISVYIRGDKIFQNRPGIEIRPSPRAKSTPHGIEAGKAESTE